jgi:hypothetical protein
MAPLSNFKRAEQQMYDRADAASDDTKSFGVKKRLGDTLAINCELDGDGRLASAF